MIDLYYMVGEIVETGELFYTYGSSKIGFNIPNGSGFIVHTYQRIL